MTFIKAQLWTYDISAVYHGIPSWCLLPRNTRMRKSTLMQTVVSSGHMWGRCVEPTFAHDAEYRVTGFTEEQLLTHVCGTFGHYLPPLSSHQVQQLIDKKAGRECRYTAYRKGKRCVYKHDIMTAINISNWRLLMWSFGLPHAWFLRTVSKIMRIVGILKSAWLKYGLILLRTHNATHWLVK